MQSQEVGVTKQPNHVGISTGSSTVPHAHVRDTESASPARLVCQKTGRTGFEKKLMNASIDGSNNMSRVPFTLALAGDELSESQMNEIILVTDSDAMPVVRSGRSFVAAWADDAFRQSVTKTINQIEKCGLTVEVVSLDDGSHSPDIEAINHILALRQIMDSKQDLDALWLELVPA